jgi:hypothetical protein
MFDAVCGVVVMIGMKMRVGFAWGRIFVSGRNPNSNPKRNSCDVISFRIRCNMQSDRCLIYLIAVLR